jgi:NADPH:quinone reductase-like Zn-dependent oxidoreductase
MFTENEHVVGCDLVGIVEQVGSSAERFSPGTVVAGVVWAGELFSSSAPHIAT